MERKKFITTTLAALPLLALGKLPLDSERTKKPFVTRAGKSRIGEPMLYKGVHPNNVVVSKRDTDNQLSVFSYTGYAKIGPSVHMHFNQDELFHIVEGRYRFVVGDETMELEAGDTIFLPRRIPHSWIQLTDAGRLLYAVQPAGTLEEFFTEMNRLKKAPTEAEAKKIHLAHGMKLIGPPLSL